MGGRVSFRITGAAIHHRGSCRFKAKVLCGNDIGATYTITDDLHLIYKLLIINGVPEKPTEQSRKT